MIPATSVIPHTMISTLTIDAFPHERQRKHHQANPPGHTRDR